MVGFCAIPTARFIPAHAAHNMAGVVTRPDIAERAVLLDVLPTQARLEEAIQAPLQRIQLMGSVVPRMAVSRAIPIAKSTLALVAPSTAGVAIPQVTVGPAAPLDAAATQARLGLGLEVEVILGPRQHILPMENVVPPMEVSRAIPTAKSIPALAVLSMGGVAIRQATAVLAAFRAAQDSRLVILRHLLQCLHLLSLSSAYHQLPRSRAPKRLTAHAVLEMATLIVVTGLREVAALCMV